MIEIVYLTLKNSVKYVELITAIIGTIYFYKYKHTCLKYFLLILWYVVINEFLGFFLKKAGFTYNVIIYNIYHLINFSFLFILYKTYIKNSIHKKYIKYFLVIYIISFFGNMFYQNYFTQAQTIPFIIGAVFLIISIVFYFSEILNTDKVLYINKNLFFWISIGLFLYHIGKIPTRIIRNYYNEIPNFKSISITESSLSIIMCICFIIGFIWSEKDKQFY